MSDMVPRIVLYDGVCGLCHWTVAWLLRHDPEHKLWFAPLQGETAARLREQHPEIPQGLDTVVYIEDGRVFMRSRSFVHIARHLPRPWRWVYALRWVPAMILDLGYRLVAATRYRLFGKHDTCRAPTAEDRSRLLP